MFKIFKIKGDSLFPTYKNGERVFCRKVFITTALKENDAVVFSNTTYGEMIKLIRFGDGFSYYMHDTNPQSMDSKVFGAVSIKDIKYKVLFKI